MSEPPTIEAVLWDFGGVLVSSPFDAFARYEAAHDLPSGFLRTVNASNPLGNSWARLERGEIDLDQFDVAFADESERLGHRVPGADALALLDGEVRPEMVGLLDRVIAAGFRTACLTNNVARGSSVERGGGATAHRPSPARESAVAAVMARFELVLESSKVGVRKPEPRFYEIACEQLSVAPDRCLFLDDLGINLKPAALMGMTTVKVSDPRVAIAEVESILSLPSA